MQMRVRAAPLISVRLQAPARRDDHPPVVARTIVVTSCSNAQQRVSHPRLPARKPCVAADSRGPTASHNAARRRAPRIISAPQATTACHPHGGHKTEEHPPLSLPQTFITTPLITDQYNAWRAALPPPVPNPPVHISLPKQAHHTAVTCGGASIASGAPPGAGSMASRAGSRSGRSAGPSAVGRPWLASKNRSVCREWAS